MLKESKMKEAFALREEQELESEFDQEEESRSGYEDMRSKQTEKIGGYQGPSEKEDDDDQDSFIFMRRDQLLDDKFSVASKQI